MYTGFKGAYAVGTKMAFGTDIVINLLGLNRVQLNLKVLENWKLAGIPILYFSMYDDQRC